MDGRLGRVAREPTIHPIKGREKGATAVRGDLQKVARLFGEHHRGTKMAVTHMTHMVVTETISGATPLVRPLGRTEAS